MDASASIRADASSSHLHVTKKELPKGQIIFFAIAIILGIGGIAVLGVGVAGCLGSINNLGHVHALIITITGGVVSGTMFLVIGIGLVKNCGTKKRQDKIDKNITTSPKLKRVESISLKTNTKPVTKPRASKSQITSLKTTPTPPAHLKDMAAPPPLSAEEYSPDQMKGRYENSGKSLLEGEYQLETDFEADLGISSGPVKIYPLSLCHQGNVKHRYFKTHEERTRFVMELGYVDARQVGVDINILQSAYEWYCVNKSIPYNGAFLWMKDENQYRIRAIYRQNGQGQLYSMSHVGQLQETLSQFKSTNKKGFYIYSHPKYYYISRIDRSPFSPSTWQELPRGWKLALYNQKPCPEHEDVDCLSNVCDVFEINLENLKKLDVEIFLRAPDLNKIQTPWILNLLEDLKK